MTPIGEQLREARERKGLELDRVSEETNIARRYLAALEAEDFGVFPGDPYAIGFLRNYAEFLGLPSDELAQAYKNMRIQEQPVPIQELIPKRGPSPLVLGAAIGGGVLVLALALLLAFGGRKGGSEEEALAHRAPAEYRLEGAALEKRLYAGDSIIASAGAEKYKLVISRIDDAVTLDSPSGSSRLMLGEEITVDLDKNNQPELKILVSDLAKKDPAKGALVRVEYASPEAANKAAAAAPTPAAPQAEVAAAEAPKPAPAPEPAPAAAGAKGAVLFESSKSPYPFVVSVTFRGPCMFRYEIDRKDRDERYYRKGETITVNANNSVKLWASNAQSAKLTVQASGGKSADLDLGGPGEVAVKRIAWSQPEGGGWALSAAEVD
ncbi:MAG TPA: helix-turn-helix domain-containing protein [Spirochaetales bacterium]|nr:helix-turn-helix domain-containing protein [Spirochaetales bacterium]HRY55874.1 helix-turn-helix domain-containing protein [Spirochaetia bacterium]HRZ65318.1 helix-turn-helix domain-containing protein [Spirochaetia bacterium]